jgi:hypothetical protein
MCIIIPLPLLKIAHRQILIKNEYVEVPRCMVQGTPANSTGNWLDFHLLTMHCVLVMVMQKCDPATFTIVTRAHPTNPTIWMI